MWNILRMQCLQCLDTVGWQEGHLVCNNDWLWWTDWSQVQMICMFSSSSCQHYQSTTSIISCSSKAENGLTCASGTKQYNLIPANVQWCLVAGKVTVGLASHWPHVTVISGSPPTGSRPRRVRWSPAYAVLVEYGELYHALLTNSDCPAWLTEIEQHSIDCIPPPTSLMSQHCYYWANAK